MQLINPIRKTAQSGIKVVRWKLQKGGLIERPHRVSLFFRAR